MAVTYVGTLLTDLDKIRFAIGDTVTSAGPKPADANFTDAELTALVTVEGTWQRATAAVFENLAALWAKHVTFSAGDMSATQSDVAAMYDSQAKTWRMKWGSAAATGSGSSGVIRADGYSDDLDNVTA